jgi:hypothetical protein
MSQKSRASYLRTYSRNSIFGFQIRGPSRERKGAEGVARFPKILPSLKIIIKLEERNFQERHGPFLMPFGGGP